MTNKTIYFPFLQSTITIMSFDSKFKSFLKILHDGPYELPEELNAYLRSSLLSAGFDAVSAGSSVSSVSVSSKPTRKMSGYNVFMKDKMAELKTQGIAANERMGQVSKLWKELSDADKLVWKETATTLNGTTEETTSSPKKVKSSAPKKLSGYQMFVKATMPLVMADTTVTAKERMGAVAKRWKDLSDSDRDGWKAKADAEPTVSV